MDYAKLKTELTTDPLARGYAGMSDLQVCNSLNTANRQVDPATLPTALILTGMDLSEFAALTADQKLYLGFIFNRDEIDIRNGTKTRAALLAMFGAGSQTRSAVLALMTRLISRADEIGIGWVRVGDVTMTRAM